MAHIENNALCSMICHESLAEYAETMSPPGCVVDELFTSIRPNLSDGFFKSWKQNVLFRYYIHV